MPDPTNENAGATPPESEPAAEPPQELPRDEAVETQTQATPPSEAPAKTTPAAEGAPAQDQAAAASAAEQPTAQMPPAYAAAPAAPAALAAGVDGPWYRRRWALITGAVAAAAVLFLGGMAVGGAVWGDDGRDGFRVDHPGMFRGEDGRGFGHGDWGDSGNGMVPPGMGQGQGRGWNDDGGSYGRPHEWQSPGATPAPVPSGFASPQSLTQ